MILQPHYSDSLSLSLSLKRTGLLFYYDGEVPLTYTVLFYIELIMLRHVMFYSLNQTLRQAFAFFNFH